MLCKIIPRLSGSIGKSVLNPFMMLALAIKLTFSCRMASSGKKNLEIFLVCCLGIEKNGESDHSEKKGVVGIDFVGPQVHSNHCREITVG
jgi:hypothetical protein